MEDYESRRHELYNDLERVLGERSAGTLMTSLPPNEWADLATKADLDAGLTSVRKDMAAEFKLVRTEMAQQGADLRGEIARQGTELRAEIVQQGTELRGEIGELRVEVVELHTKVDAGFEKLTTDFGSLRNQVAAEVYKALFDLSLRMYVGLAGVVVGVCAAGFALAQLLKA